MTNNTTGTCVFFHAQRHRKNSCAARARHRARRARRRAIAAGAAAAGAWRAGARAARCHARRRAARCASSRAPARCASSSWFASIAPSSIAIRAASWWCAPKSSPSTSRPRRWSSALKAQFQVLRTEDLADLGVKITVLQTPEGMSASRGLKKLRKLDPEGTYDFNHVYLESGESHGGARAAGAGRGRTGGRRRRRARRTHRWRHRCATMSRCAPTSSTRLVAMARPCRAHTARRLPRCWPDPRAVFMALRRGRSCSPPMCTAAVPPAARWTAWPRPSAGWRANASP